MEDQQQLDIRRYVQVVYKKRHLFIMMAAGIITIVTAVSYVMPTIYEATTKVSIAKNYLNVIMRDIAVTPAMDDQVQALSVVMTSRSMLQLVLADLSIDMGKMSEEEIQKIVTYYQKSTQIKFDYKSSRNSMDLFTITYRDRDPRFARDYVNALVKRYIIENLSTKREDALGANRFIYEQMELYRQKIGRTETALDQRRKERGVQTAEHLKKLQRKYDDLLVQYTDKHPEVVRLKSEIELTRQQVREQERADTKGVESTDNTHQTGSEGKKSVADLERDRDAYKKIYESLVATLGRSEVSSQVEVQAKAETFKILEPAVLPIKPVSRPRWIVIVMGIGAGIAGAAGMVILLDMMDKTIKNVDTLKEFGLPVIGVIPRIQSVDAIAAARRKDVLAYGFAGLHLAGIAAIIVVEYLR